jgi:tight adherence protein B
MNGAVPIALVHFVLVLVAGQQARRAARAAHTRSRLRSSEPTPGRRRPWASLRWPGRAARAEGALADVVDMLASALATGAPVSDALEAAARTAPEVIGAPLEEAARSVRGGLPIVDALERWAGSDAGPDGAGLVVAAFAIASATGGDPAAGLAGVGATLRERRAVAREVHALASQARASATVIALAPVGFALVTAGLGGTAARFLLGSPVGIACLLAGGGLDVAGWRWMRRITESVR